ncbi:MAG: O-antigen ligase family protein, partial [Cetobacterium sp.]
FYVLNFLGMEAFNYKTSYKINLFNFIIFYSIVYWILILLKDAWEEVNFKIKDLKLDNIFKFFVLLFLFFLFINVKYSIRITTYVLIPLTIIKVCKNKRIKIDKLTIYILPFFIAILLSMWNAIYKKNIFRMWQDYSGIFLLPICYAQFEYGKRFNRLIEKIFLLGFFLRLTLGYLEKMNLLYSPTYPSRVGGGGEVFRYAGIIMFGVIYFAYKVINSKEKFINSYGLFISILVLIWTQNRANWVAVFFVVIFFILEKILREKTLKKAIIKLILFLGILIGVSILAPNNMYVQRINSMKNYKSDSVGGSRIKIWKNSIRIFKEKPFLGVGFHIKNFAAHEIPEKNGYNFNHNDSHNTYLFIASTMGIIGVFSYGYLLLGIFYESIKKKSVTIINLGMFFGYLIMGFFTSNIIYLDMVGVIICLLAFDFNKE